MQRIDAIKAIARNLRDLVVDSTPASAAATHVDVLALIHPVTDQLQGSDWYAYTGGGLGQERIVTSFNVANRRLGFNQALTTVPSTNTNFIVTRFWQKVEYDSALDRMIGMAKLINLQESVATLNIIGTQYEYPVPSGMEFINTLRIVPSASSSGFSDYDTDNEAMNIFEFPPRLWRIETNPLGSYLISFDARKISLDDFDGQSVRIMGQVKPNVNATDNGTIPVELEEFVINGASMLLASQRIDEGSEWRSKFGMFRDNHRELENYIHRPRRGKQVG